MNEQKPETRAEWHTGQIDVVSIWKTIQGEGPFAGRPAVFIRLAGCNLACPMCDTDYTSTRNTQSAFSAADTAASLADELHSKLIVITGGEPLRQDLSLLVMRLIVAGFQVQIETNGSLVDSRYVDINHPGLFTVVSPKTAMLPSIISEVENLTYKYVLEAGFVSEIDGLPTRVLGYDRYPARPYKGYAGEVYVQPLDSHDGNNDRHLDAAVQSCMTYGYRLSIQSHKLTKLL